MKTREVTEGKGGGKEETENMMKRKEESRAVCVRFLSHLQPSLFYYMLWNRNTWVVMVPMDLRLPRFTVNVEPLRNSTWGQHPNTMNLRK